MRKKTHTGWHPGDHAGGAGDTKERFSQRAPDATRALPWGYIVTLVLLHSSVPLLRKIIGYINITSINRLMLSPSHIPFLTSCPWLSVLIFWFLSIGFVGQHHPFHCLSSPKSSAVPSTAAGDENSAVRLHPAPPGPQLGLESGHQQGESTDTDYGLPVWEHKMPIEGRRPMGHGMRGYGMWDESLCPPMWTLWRVWGWDAQGSMKVGCDKPSTKESEAGCPSLGGRMGGDRAAPRHQDGSRDSPHCPHTAPSCSPAHLHNVS